MGFPVSTIFIQEYTLRDCLSHIDASNVLSFSIWPWEPSAECKQAKKKVKLLICFYFLAGVLSLRGFCFYFLASVLSWPSFKHGQNGQELIFFLDLYFLGLFGRT